MSVASERGKNFELKVAKRLRSKLNISVARDKRSGASWNKADITDYWSKLPLHLELKDQENIKIQEWFRQSVASSSFGKAPTVIFASDEEVLATLRLDDLLNFLVEITDMRAEIDDLRKPVETIKQRPEQVLDVVGIKSQHIKEDLEKTEEKVIECGATTCREGHIADVYGYCLQSTCKYSRGYRKPKEKRK
jgi:hypothetical protein